MASPKRGYRIVPEDELLALKPPPQRPLDREWEKRIYELERRYVLEYRRRKLEGESL
jgi:hypothetical protein